MEKFRSVVDDVVIERGASDEERVKSGDGKEEFDRKQVLCKENWGILPVSSSGDVAGRLSAGRNRGEISGLSGIGALFGQLSC